MLAAILFLILESGVTAAPATPSINSFDHDVWTTTSGLPHNTVHGIAQTRDGYLWFGTWEGLARHNGTGFTIFSRTSRPALPDSAVSAVLADRAGNLWISDTRGNVGRRNLRGDWKFWGKSQGVPHAAINTLAEDAQGRIWIGFDRVGVGRIGRTGSFTLLPRPPGAAAVSVMQIAIGGDGAPWLGTLDGLFRVAADGRWLERSADLGLPRGRITPSRDINGRIWLAGDKAVYRLDGDRVARVFVLPSGDRLSDFLAASNGDLWIGTENGGLLRVGPSGWDRLSTRNGLPEGRITAIFEDREHSIWVGVNSGLFRLREALFANHRTDNGLSGNYVRALAETSDGKMWIGSSKGLDQLRATGEPRAVPLGVGGSANGISVLSLCAGPEGDLWVGTFGDGVLRVRHDRVVSRIGEAHGLPSGHVRALAQARGGGVWVGTRRGIAFIDEAGRVRRPTARNLPVDMVYALSETAQGLWIGTVSGAWLWNRSGVHRIDVMRAGDAGSVFGFFQDPRAGVTWLSTDRGLFRRRRDGRLDQVGFKHGLPVDGVFQMVVDQAGAAWMGSNRGVVRLPYTELMAAADGRLRRVSADLFGSMDGMYSAQGNGASGPTSLLRRDGTVWFATADGAASVDPGLLNRFRSLPPVPVVIERIEVDGHVLQVAPGSEITLPPGTRRLGIVYAGLSFLMPHGIRYRTMMEGLDGKWVERGSQHVAEFTTLPPGDYKFRVEAAQPGGRWDQGTAFHVTVTPFLWQRGWFRVLALIVVLVMLTVVHRWRMLALSRREKRLGKLIEERTADLSQQSRLLAQAAEEKEQLLNQLRGQANALEQLANEDPLTGLSNRRRFDNELAQVAAASLRDRRHWSLAIIDIDHFKQVNDRYSHAIGDLALCAVAEELRQTARSSDLVARLGGEEFALLMPATTAEEARVAGERVRTSIGRRDFEPVAAGLAVTVSVGVATWTPTAGEPLTILYAADAALYRAKAGGRDRVAMA